MGQAFDKSGAILGEIYANTKHEVFDKLINLHPDAHEIRIRTVDDEFGEAEKRLAGATTKDPRLDRMLADLIVSTLPSNQERTVALRKLLEAKDCAVRAQLERPGG